MLFDWSLNHKTLRTVALEKERETEIHEWMDGGWVSDLDTTGIFIFSIYLNINQLDALSFIMSLFHASTCFEHKCSSSGGQNCTIHSLVSSH